MTTTKQPGWPDERLTRISEDIEAYLWALAPEDRAVRGAYIQGIIAGVTRAMQKKRA